MGWFETTGAGKQAPLDSVFKMRRVMKAANANTGSKAKERLKINSKHVLNNALSARSVFE